MRILLLGSNGQLGSDIRRANDARQRPHDLVPLVRSQADVSDYEALGAVLLDAEFDGLINCTGYHRTDEAEENATHAFAVNARAVQTMAETCAAKKAGFFHVSTDYVFDGENRDTPYREDDSTSPINVYGASKAMGERLALMAHHQTTVLRVASLFGVAGASGKGGGNFVERTILSCRKNGRMRVVDDQRMSPTATADVARMLFEMIDGRAGPGIYHAVNSGSASWFEFAGEIVDRTAIEAVVEPIASSEFTTLARRPRYSVLDNAKIQDATAPVRDWRVALDSYLRDRRYIE